VRHAVEVGPLDRDLAAPVDLDVDLGEAEAPLLAAYAPLARDQARVDQHDLLLGLLRVARRVQDEEAGAPAHLRRGEPDAAVGVHDPEPLLHPLADLGRDRADLRGLLHEPRIGEEDDFEFRRHGGDVLAVERVWTRVFAVLGDLR
jgi:hypothetical protein